MDLAYVRRLIDLLAHAPVTELEVEEGGCRIRITRAGAQAAATPAGGIPVPGPDFVPAPDVPRAAADVPADTADDVSGGDGAVITAPSYGVLHLSPSPGAAPYVTVGQDVRVGQEVALVEAMKVFGAVRATVAGRVAAVLVDDGAEVEAGTPLFRLA
ncbi:acetyl-CoA carboxylase biotin carboxyl carrier protein [Novacetimonas pomaceti]|uniref:Biotin carboxyl carrier protein of acetyl-CoA carboxylase n=1 Tax=Novacetimonas pomaceti TaxID=2021998 RepID=A0ABX5P448_9PROT|nr:biotin/lipoyl-containing protein [Novacetimonas pomaceti]PYD48549.1 acetyl-CoA carboxylase biotin carboxyl carrier protein subunit [Novacetimonas pomaceti]